MRFLLILGVLLAAPAADAFASVPPRSIHEDITREAAATAGWPDKGIDALVTAVHAPDHEEVAWEPQADAPVRYDLTERYVPAHHCDRIPPEDDATAFRSTLEHIRANRHAAKQAQDAEDVVRHTGAALHALQDCFSHSDFVDLSGDARQQFVDAILKDTAPPAVRLAAVQPGIEKPGLPDDPYPHDRYAKDRADFNNESEARIDGETKFDLAVQAATDASMRLMEQILEALAPEVREELAHVESDYPDRFPIPGPLAVSALLMAMALLRRP